MKSKLLLFFLVCIFSFNIYGETALEKRPLIQIETSKGDIIIRLFPDEAPLTCKNFLNYVNDSFYDNTLIHRVIDGFLIQAGGFNTDYDPKKNTRSNQKRIHKN